MYRAIHAFISPSRPSQPLSEGLGQDGLQRPAPFGTQTCCRRPVMQLAAWEARSLAGIHAPSGLTGPPCVTWQGCHSATRRLFSLPRQDTDRVQGHRTAPTWFPSSVPLHQLLPCQPSPNATTINLWIEFLSFCHTACYTHTPSLSRHPSGPIDQTTHGLSLLPNPCPQRPQTSCRAAAVDYKLALINSA